MAKSQVTVVDAIREYVDELNKAIKVDKVILFGSQVTGNTHEWSDIDLLVLSHDFANMDFIKRLELLATAKIRGHCDLAIEAIGHTPEEYDAANHLTFLGEIKRTGKVVYEAP